MSLSQNSKALLGKAHPSLRRLAEAVAAKGVPFRVTCSVRSAAEQNRAFRAGLSKARAGQSPHNYNPSAAIDIAPGWDGPINWQDTAAFDRVAAAFLDAAKALGVSLRWGADWDMDGKTSDERFVDRPHIELHPWRNFIKGKTP